MSREIPIDRPTGPDETANIGISSIRVSGRCPGFRRVWLWLAVDHLEHASNGRKTVPTLPPAVSYAGTKVDH